MEYKLVLRDSFQLFRKYLLMMLLFIVVQITTVYLMQLVVYPHLNTFLTARQDIGTTFTVMFTLNIVYLFFYYVMYAAFTLFVVNKERSTGATFSQIMIYSLRRVIPLFLTTFLIALLMGLGILLLIVPGFIILTGCSMAVFCSLIEGAGPIASIKESFTLTKGSRMKLFILFLGIGVLEMVVQLSISLTGGIAKELSSFILLIVSLIFLGYTLFLEYAVWRALKKTL